MVGIKLMMVFYTHVSVSLLLDLASAFHLKYLLKRANGSLSISSGDGCLVEIRISYLRSLLCGLFISIHSEIKALSESRAVVKYDVIRFLMKNCHFNYANKWLIPFRAISLLFFLLDLQTLLGEHYEFNFWIRQNLF